MMQIDELRSIQAWDKTGLLDMVETTMILVHWQILWLKLGTMRYVMTNKIQVDNQHKIYIENVSLIVESH